MRFQVGKHDLESGRRILGHSQCMPCVGLQIHRHVGRFWECTVLDTLLCVRAFTVAIAVDVVKLPGNQLGEKILC